MLIDSHCHLDLKEFTEDLDCVVKRALCNNVQFMITISTLISRFDRIRTITEKYANIFCSIGTHPHYVHEDRAVTAHDLIELAEYPKVVAIGETGLDYQYDNSMIGIQKQAFLIHIEAARKSRLPLVIHSRNADHDMEEILRREIKKDGFLFILHCYASSVELAQAVIELGGYLSFSGLLTFKNASNIREIAKIIPHNRILVETDSPYLAPIPYRGQRNEPSFIIKTIKVLARTLDMSDEEITKITTLNALRAFSKIVFPVGE